MLEAGEAAAGTLDPLHAQVHALGRPVGGTGAVMVQDLVDQRSRVSPRERISGTSSPWHPTMALRSRCGLRRPAGQIDVADRFFGQPAPSSSSWGSPWRSPSSMRSWPRSSRRSAPFNHPHDLAGHHQGMKCWRAAVGCGRRRPLAAACRDKSGAGPWGPPSVATSTNRRFRFTPWSSPGGLRQPGGER